MITKKERDERDQMVLDWIDSAPHCSGRSPCLGYNNGSDFVGGFGDRFIRPKGKKDLDGVKSYRAVCRILNRMVKDNVLRRHALGCDVKESPQEGSYCWSYSRVVCGGSLRKR